MSRVQVRGGSLHTKLDARGAEAPWLILSNGIATDHTVWDAQVPLFASAFNVIRYDARGHGASDAIAGPYSFDDLVADVIAILDHYEVKKATYLGLSLGGMTGLGVGLRHADRLDALVCCNARADGPEPFVKSWDDRLAAIANGGMAAIAGGTLERWLSPSTHAGRPGEVERLGAMIRGTSVAGFAGCAAALKTLDYLRHLGALGVRTLYVAGADDGGAPVPAMQAMAQATPGAGFAVIPHCAHMSNVDNPEGFAAAVAPFLARSGMAAA